jgi:hypothetical protein
MHSKKSLDQIFLLVVALTVIAGLYSLIIFIDQRGISESTGFFITANVFLSFILTWNAKVSFGRTPRFWEYHVMWMFVHAAIAVVWGYSGFWDRIVRRASAAGGLRLLQSYELSA